MANKPISGHKDGTSIIVKLALTALISIILTGAGSWFGYGKDAVSEDKVEKIVANRVGKIEADVKEIKTDIKVQKEELIKIQINQAISTERLDTIVKFIEKNN